MEFKEFKQLLQDHVDIMLRDVSVLFVADTDKDEIWNTYLDSFPEGTNEIFRERRYYDCSCCRHFVKQFGSVVAVKNNSLVSIWDFRANDEKFQPVVDALSAYVKSAPIKDVFVTKESAFGTDHSHEQMEDDTVHTWHHFRAELPSKFITKSFGTVATVAGKYRDVKNVFQRSLEEISKDAIETVFELIAQKSLYKGEEWQGALNKFLNLHSEYHGLPDDRKDLYCWSKSVEVGGAIGKIRNHSIGVLLVDVSNGVDLNEAVRKYEAIVAPTNYKRPKAIFTQKMVEQAQEKIVELGLSDSLGRRFATIDDITVNNILFANRDAAKRLGGNVFDDLKQDVVTSPKKFDRVEEIQVEHFIEHILPTTTGIEVFVENSHSSNLVSVIAPQNKDAKTMFKWNNGFSWAYAGNITDSIKERVKAFGGNVNGVLRASLQWDNNNDFDLHCVEPNGNHIYYPTKGRVHNSSGMLDVDIIHPSRDSRVVDGIAVENIVYTNDSKMPKGVYDIFVNNYTHRGGRTGFSAQIEYDGVVYDYEYNRELRQNENVRIAKIQFDNGGGIKFLESLPSSISSKTVWGIQTNQFNAVSICMFSPNYWDEQTGIGHRHYFFILNGCKNDDRPNGFFNEFLREDLMEYKRVFEALGGKKRVAPSDNQLSGLGFSSTKRNSLVCKLEGHTSRIVKIIF